jgi:hypothetical protein
MQLCAGYLFGIFSLWGYRTRHYIEEGPKAVRHYGRIGTHCRLVLTTAISIYGIWFWVYGIRYDLHHGLARVTDDSGNPRPAACYPVYVFFFAKLNVLGGIRILYVIMTICTALYYGTMLLAAVAERIRHLTQVISKEKGHEKRETLNYDTGLTKREQVIPSLVICKIRLTEQLFLQIEHSFPHQSRIQPSLDRLFRSHGRDDAHMEPCDASSRTKWTNNLPGPATSYDDQRTQLPKNLLVALPAMAKPS